MKNRIVFVDEDIYQVQTWADVFQSKGWSIMIIRDATKAYEELSSISNLTIALIDVMLAGRSAGQSSRYSAEETDGYMETGLCLYDELKEANPTFFPARSILVSHTDKRSIIDKAKKRASDDGTMFIKKSDINGPYDLFERITKHLETL